VINFSVKATNPSHQVKKGEKLSDNNLQFEIQDSLPGTAGSMGNADATIVP
jgi:hypothetical protein